MTEKEKGPLTRAFVVAGAGFEPATSGYEHLSAGSRRSGIILVCAFPQARSLRADLPSGFIRPDPRPPLANRSHAIDFPTERRACDRGRAALEGFTSRAWRVSRDRLAHLDLEIVEQAG